ncbi:hypothetical protein [Frankia sp. CiP1_Cm_nod1]|uniref:hypothetical protein n=1 Tax=Frankia sp. CiP1_Cm_nod1 TaxID=2897160 RepID=UPI002024C826
MIPFFDGVGAVLTLLHSLAVDPARRRSAPLVCLVAGPDSGPWLTEVRQRVRWSPSPVIPRAYLDLAPEGRRHSTSPPLPRPDGQPHVLPVLQALADQLETQTSGLGCRFRTYVFADWLTRQQLAPLPPGKTRKEVLGERLRAKLAGAHNGANPLLDGLSGLTRLLLAVLIIVGPRARFRLWQSGYIPVPGLVRTRWFMRQRLFPAENGEGFASFAVRLAADTHRVPEEEAQREHLLVDAFLHDLRAVYRRRFWRLWAWRRTARVLALIDNIADDPQGERLLDMIITVRDSTRKNDPLLLVAGYQADTIPQPPPQPLLSAANAADALDAWNTAEPPSGADWRLWLRIPAFASAPPSEETVGPHARGWGQHLSAPKPPLWARRWALRSLAVVLLAAVVLGILRYGTHVFDHDGCWSRTGVSVSWVNGQCVGYSDGSYRFNAGRKSISGDRLLAVQQEIARQNRCAVKLAALSPGNIPYTLMTLVYFAGLTGETETDWTAAQVAELEGLLTWQHTLNQKQDIPECGTLGADSSVPRMALRVLIANGGSHMRYADLVARDHLVPLAARPREKVLGVIGMDRSNMDTGRAVATLGNARIPVIATTLSGDAMEIFSPSYFQMVPNNRREAQLATAYAKKAQQGISVYYPRSPGDPRGQEGDPAVDDLYVSTLVQDVRNEATRAGLRYEPHGWGPGENTPDWFRERCAGENQSNLLFFAGRYNDFPGFLDGMRACLDRVLADDSVSRYVVQAAGQWNNTTAFRFVSKGAPVVLAGKKCLDGTLTQGLFVSRSLEDFCHRLKSMYEATGRAQHQTLWADERIGISYDAAKLFVDMVTKNTAIDRTGIEKQLRQDSPTSCEDVKNFPATAWPGATGCNDFNASQIAQSKQLTVIYIDLSWKELPPYDPSNQNRQATGGQPCQFVISGREPKTSDDCLTLDKWPLYPTAGG